MTPYRGGLTALIIGLMLGALILCAVAAHAQLVTPTTTYTLAWDYAGTTLNHFEVRYATTGAWIPVGTAQQAPVPALAVGAHTAQVRACTTVIATTATCPQAALLFTVALTPPATAPTAVQVH